MRATRTAICLALAGLAATGALAGADEAPRNTATRKTLFLAQEGCGGTAEPGRLELKPQDDTADGCGTVGGLPLAEINYKVSGPRFEHFSTTTKFTPVILDNAKKITGQLAAGSWFGAGVGAGDVAFHVRLVGYTKTDDTVDFGSTSGTTSHEPGAEYAYVPFTLNVPAAAKGKIFTEFRLSTYQHGTNVGMSSKRLSGESYVTFPVKKK